MNYTNTDDANSTFYNELYKLLDNDSDTESDDKCLISDETLVDKFVKLPCGHSFNYIPLYNDIKNHKTKFNHMEASSGRLNTHEIRCPYCRSIHTSLLPYYEDLGLAKINGVNCLEPTHNISDPLKACTFVCHAPENPTNCLCTYKNTVNFFDKKMYCYYHNKTVNTTHLTQIKAEKQKIKAEKQKIKEEKQKIKEEKQKIKEEKQKIKEEKQKTKEEKQQLKEDAQNTIVIPMIIGEVVPCGCIATLKTGVRKGHVCNKRVHQDAMCKLHYYIYVK
jgi:hypothetical protein